MKRIHVSFFIFIFLFSFSGKLNAQITQFDSVRVVASSGIYDYRNPVFSYPYYSSYFQNIKLLYEVRAVNASSIAWKNIDFWNYSAENFIVNDGSMNINTTSSNYMIVWQSNKNGNWDLYYSLWSSSNWSAPTIIDTTLAAETNPCLYYSFYGQAYCLTFERNNDIWFKFYKNSMWQGDTNLTAGISNNCYNPAYYEQRIYYLQEVSSLQNILCCQKFGITYPGYNFIWYPVELHPKPNPVRNIHTSSEFHYEYDTLGGTNSYIVDNHNNFTIHNITLGFSGKNKNCSGFKLMVPILDNNLNDISPYTIFGFQQRSADSNKIVAQTRLDYGNTITKYFNLEDTSFNSKIAASPAVTLNYYYYKSRLVWEKKINGKVALVESFDTRIITGINKMENIIPDKFLLYQNYPNPFNPVTKIKFDLAVHSVGQTFLSVYDILGREIATLVNEQLNPGTYEVTFDGSSLASGIYFYQLKSNNFIETKKLILLK